MIKRTYQIKTTTKKPFDGVYLSFSESTINDELKKDLSTKARRLGAMVVSHKVTHFVTTEFDSAEANKAEERREILVLPQWIEDCSSHQKFFMPGRYYPKEQRKSEDFTVEMEIDEENKNTEDPREIDRNSTNPENVEMQIATENPLRNNSSSSILKRSYSETVNEKTSQKSANENKKARLEENDDIENLESNETKDMNEKNNNEKDNKSIEKENDDELSFCEENISTDNEVFSEDKNTKSDKTETKVPDIELSFSPRTEKSVLSRERKLSRNVSLSSDTIDDAETKKRLRSPFKSPLKNVKAVSVNKPKTSEKTEVKKKKLVQKKSKESKAETETVNEKIENKGKKRAKSKNKKKHICISGFKGDQLNDLFDKIAENGYTVENVITDNTTHLVSDGKRTLKLFDGISRGLFIISQEWVEKGCLENEREFLVDFPGVISCIDSSIQRPLFGKRIHIGLLNNDSLDSRVVRRIAELAGAEITPMRAASLCISDSKTQIPTVSVKWLFDSLVEYKMKNLEEYLV